MTRSRRLPLPSLNSSTDYTFEIVPWISDYMAEDDLAIEEVLIYKKHTNEEKKNYPNPRIPSVVAFSGDHCEQDQPGRQSPPRKQDQPTARKLGDSESEDGKVGGESCQIGGEALRIERTMYILKVATARAAIPL